MTMHSFIGEAIDELVNSGVSVEFTKRKFYRKNGYNFFYDGTDRDFGKTPKLKIHFYTNCMKYNFPTFIHEYCHFLQWKDKTDLWEESAHANKAFDEWLRGKIDSFSLEELRKIQFMELDCDKRAINLINERKLPVDVEKYILESNSYILSYDMCYEHRDFDLCNLCYHPNLLKTLPSSHITEEDIIRGNKNYKSAFNFLINN